MKAQNISLCPENSIWSLPVYLPYVQPILTDVMVQDAEKQLGYKLPESLINLLKIQNGGYIAYRLPDIWHNCIYGIGPNFPSLLDRSFSEEAQTFVSYPLDGLIPFDGDGHFSICLDYRASDDPCITAVDIECDEIQSIAPSFDDYLAMLERDLEHKYVLENVINIDQMLGKLSQLLNVTFETQDPEMHGYAQYAAPLKTASEFPEWLWVSPNEVPHGFIRQREKHYEELVHLTQKTIKKFSELPDCAYILQVSDETYNLLDNLENDELVCKPLSNYGIKRKFITL